MKTELKPHKRQSIRLKHYDYSAAGYYFVTVCAKDKKNILGDVVDAKIILNDIGMMIDKWWRKLSEKYDEIAIDEYCIMPNHLHGIIQIVGADPRVCPNQNLKISNNGRTHMSAPTISTIIQWFKTMSTNEYIRNIKNNNWPPLNKRLWHRNFYEHVIRNEDDLNSIREYVFNNPAKWQEDEYYVR